ncbi:MAG: hypothetical protein JHC57_10065 [Sphingopyxis sp.]|uniref:hypothetical protein n=1 Tax=Sphingopyxis sp. TaxID=1908224 RepID=UPI001A1F24DA|nr:hypothetical protein [Sphingopyxis sp.]MBJ7500086.1 hypothetical protein [Sphingopyxis sp.]
MATPLQDGGAVRNPSSLRRADHRNNEQLRHLISRRLTGSVFGQVAVGEMVFERLVRNVESALIAFYARQNSAASVRFGCPEQDASLTLALVRDPIGRIRHDKPFVIIVSFPHLAARPSPTGRAV